MKIAVRVFSVFFNQDQQQHKQAVKDLCTECFAKGGVGMGNFDDTVRPCTQIAFFSMPETDIAVQSLFSLFENRKITGFDLGQWLEDVLNEAAVLGSGRRNLERVHRHRRQGEHMAGQDVGMGHPRERSRR